MQTSSSICRSQVSWGTIPEGNSSPTMQSSGQKGPGLSPDFLQMLMGPLMPEGLSKSEGGTSSKTCDKMAFIYVMVVAFPPMTVPNLVMS